MLLKVGYWDHISGGKLFADQGAVFISHSEAKANIKPNFNVVEPGFTWTGDRHSLTVGGTTISFYHFGPSHGSGMTVFLLPAQKVAFVIDIATSGRVFPMFMPDFDIDGLVKTLDAVEALDFERVVFGHGKSAGAKQLIGTKEDIVEIGSYLDDLISSVQGAMMKGGFQAVTKLQLPQWKHLGMYDQWFSLNAQRVVISFGMGY